MTLDHKKYKAQEIAVTDHPTFIVGFGPGRQRNDTKDTDLDGIVWAGNASGDFMRECIENKENIYLTNAQNHYVPDGDIPDELWEQGHEELVEDLNEYKPAKILAFGNVAQLRVREALKESLYFDEDLNTEDAGDEEERIEQWIEEHVVDFTHPSYVIRFNKDREGLKEAVRDEL